VLFPSPSTENVIVTDPAENTGQMLGEVTEKALHTLKTVDGLFYNEGIRTVGIDRVIAESKITKATFYKHFGSRDNLVQLYVTGRCQAARDLFTQLHVEGDSAKTLTGIGNAAVSQIEAPGWRGCALLNAAAEYSDYDHPVRQLIRAHRDWSKTKLTDVFTQAGRELPGHAADDLLFAIDGLCSGAYAGDQTAAIASFRRTMAAQLPH
jgi:AcrR family transcriptional regulator